MVRGLCTHRSGVGFLGEVGPNAPMVLGTKRRRPCSAAMSRMLWSPAGERRASAFALLARAASAGPDSGLTGDVDRARQGHVGFSDGAEEGAVVHQPGDAIIHHDLPEVLVVQDVCIYERS